jgi:hypothetical protein
MPRARTDAHSSKAGDVIVHQSVGVGDVPGLLAVCCRSALQVGLGEDKALKFASAVGRGLLDALGDGDGQPMLTLEREGAVLLTAQIAVWGGGQGAPVAGWPELRAPRCVDAVAVHSNQCGTTLRLVVAIHGVAEPEPLRRSPPSNGGRFARLADRDIRHFT